jgi:hypothetical protein
MFDLGIRDRVVSGVTILTIVVGAVSLSWAQEAVNPLQEPTPTSVDQVATPMERSFKEKPEKVVLFPRLKEELKDAPPFFRDTQLDLKPRTYYFYNSDHVNDTKSEAWALGGALSYRSGWFLDRFALGSVLYTSQRLYGPDDRDGTDLLKPGQHGYTVVGQIYGRVKLFQDNFFNIYRYEYDTPYLNKDDSRMTPNTFEGYTLTGAFGGKDGALGLRYGGGYITKIKEQNSDHFTWMSQVAGAEVKRGVTFGGALFSYGRFSIGGIDYYSDDIINIGYAEAKYTLPVTDRLGVLLATQYTDQRSVGSDLLTGSSFDTHQWGVKTGISYEGAILTLGYTENANGANLQNPWSSYPGYTSAQVSDFKNAGQSAFSTQLSLDFKSLGLEGVTAYGLFVHGWGSVNPITRDSVPDENEFDVDVQWRPRWSFLKGLSFRTRYAVVHQYETPKKYIHELRLILNYDFPLL